MGKVGPRASPANPILIAALAEPGVLAAPPGGLIVA
jgi:hypothetical protein